MGNKIDFNPKEGELIVRWSSHTNHHVIRYQERWRIWISKGDITPLPNYPYSNGYELIIPFKPQDRERIIYDGADCFYHESGHVSAYYHASASGKIIAWQKAEQHLMKPHDCVNYRNGYIHYDYPT